MVMLMDATKLAKKILRLVCIAILAVVVAVGLFWSLANRNPITLSLWFACFLLCFIIEGIFIANEKLSEANDHLATISERLKR